MTDQFRSPDSELYERTDHEEVRLIQDVFDRMVPSEVQFSLKPTWGVSELRDDVTTTGTGAQVAESGGALVHSSGSDGTGVAQLRTLERGQYRPENRAKSGVGVLLPSDPTGDQTAEWGLLTDDYGLGWGADSTSPYVVRRDVGQQDSLVHQADWNVDPLDGSGPSGLSLDLSDGHVFLVYFRWYGFDDIRWVVMARDPENNRTVKVEVHREMVLGSLSITDPNLPIRTRVENGGTASNLDMHIGGRQFTLRGGEADFQQRSVPEQLVGYSIDTEDGWVPLIAARRKTDHGPSDRPNSVRVVTEGLEVLADQLLEYKWAYGATVSGGPGWSAPTGWPADESAIETQLQDGSLTVSDEGFPFLRGRVAAGKNAVRSSRETEQLVMGEQREVVLFGRRPSGTNTTVQSASVQFDEQW